MNVIKNVTFEGRLLEQIRRAIDDLETQVKEHSYLGEGTGLTPYSFAPQQSSSEFALHSAWRRLTVCVVS